MKIGLMELVVVFAVALIVIGPDKLPAYARKLGMALREFRKATEGLTKDFQENVVVPLDEAQRPLREAMEPLQDLERGVRSDLREVESSLRDIGKPKKAAPSRAAAEAQAAPEAPAPELAGTSAPAEKTLSSAPETPAASEGEMEPNIAHNGNNGGEMK